MRKLLRYIPTWNEVALYIAVFFLWLASRKQADKLAEWDSAMDCMESLAVTPAGLQDLQDKFETLAQRAAERRHDIEIEAGERFMHPIPAYVLRKPRR